jgi:hypothetical protein
VYRNALAREVLRLGYEIESQRDSRGHDCGFEIAGTPADLLRRFSQRSHQRDQAVREFEAERGRPPTDNEIAVLVRESRADKLIEISTEEVRAQQRGTIDTGGCRIAGRAQVQRANKLPETSHVLAAVAGDLKRVSGEFAQATNKLEDAYDGAVRRAQDAVADLHSTASNATDRVRRAAEELSAVFQREFRWSVYTLSAV